MPELAATGDGSVSSSSLLQPSPEVPEVKIVDEVEEEEDDLQKLLVPNVDDLSYSPLRCSIQFHHLLRSRFYEARARSVCSSACQWRLCVIGLASSHVALKDEGDITAVDFNVGKFDRSGIKVTGKRKKNAQLFESNTALCKVCTNDGFYIVRWCVKGSLLEVNERLIKQHGLLTSETEREGYIAIIMPRPADWLKAKASLMNFEEYKKLKRRSLA